MLPFHDVVTPQTYGPLVDLDHTKVPSLLYLMILKVLGLATTTPPSAVMATEIGSITRDSVGPEFPKVRIS
jgi:hypothetical protein